MDYKIYTIGFSQAEMEVVLIALDEVKSLSKEQESRKQNIEKAFLDHADFVVVGRD